jgi:hypothetical protein
MMKTRIQVYTCMERVPTVFLPTLYKLTLGRRGYMLYAAQVLLWWRMKKPVAITYVDGRPVGWMFFDPIEKNKLNMYVAKPYRHKGFARRMAVALKKKYPKMRMGVYYAYVAPVIKGLAKPRHTY